MQNLNERLSSLRHRRTMSASPPTRNSNNLEGNFEYQSEDSESDSISSTTEVAGAFCENCPKVKLERRTQSPRNTLFLTKEGVRHSILNCTGDYTFSTTRLHPYVNNILVAVFIVLALYCITNLLRSSSNPHNVDTRRTCLLEFEKYLSEFASKFGNITKEQLRVIFHVGRQWFLMLQKNPVVLIVAGDESGDIVQAISEVFRIAFRIPSPVMTFDLSSESMRSELHEKLASAAHSTVPLTILNGIDHLAWDTPLALHAFADDSSASSSRTLLLLTIKQNFHRTKRECEESVMEYLSLRWINGGGSIDNVSPILSRIMQFLICL